jgi:hypothetical protein
MSKARDIADSAATINVLDGVTASPSEINILDGVTSTTAELNILDGVTSTTAELNYTDGVTSNLQTQLDAKQALDSNLTSFVSAFTLPTSDGSNGQVLTTNGSGTLSLADAGGGGFTQSSLVSLVTDATSVEFTGIPAGTTFIIVHFIKANSDDDQNDWGIALGGTSGYKTSGYESDQWRSYDGTSTNASASYHLGIADWNSTNAMVAVAYITRITGNQFLAMGINQQGGGGIGFVDLGEELTKLKVQLTESNRDFDGGQIGISYM